MEFLMQSVFAAAMFAAGYFAAKDRGRQQRIEIQVGMLEKSELNALVESLKPPVDEADDAIFDAEIIDVNEE